MPKKQYDNMIESVGHLLVKGMTLKQCLEVCDEWLDNHGGTRIHYEYIPVASLPDYEHKALSLEGYDFWHLLRDAERTDDPWERYEKRGFNKRLFEATYETEKEPDV